MNLVIKILFPICVLLAWISSNVSRQGAIAYTIFSIALGYFLLRNQKKYQKEKYQKESNNQDALKKWELEYEQQKIKRHQQSERDKQKGKDSRKRKATERETGTTRRGRKIMERETRQIARGRTTRTHSEIW